MKQSKANRVLPREYNGHSKHPLPTTQEKTLHMDITRWSLPKSDWLHSLQPFRYDRNQMPYDYTVEVSNRYKGLDLIDRVPEDYEWRFVTSYSPQKKKCKKAKWFSKEALQRAGKRREVKCKGENKRYNHLNAEFQRIARRGKKASLSDQCKEIEENNRMGKTRDLSRKLEI